VTVEDAGDLTREIGRLGPRLQQVPDDLRTKTRTAIRTAASPLAARAKQNASWSTRIPRAIRIGTSFTGKNAGVTLRVALRTAPHGRAYEDLSGASRNGTFRHPVFGHRDRWTTQKTRPFIAPAVSAGRDKTLRDVDEAITTVLVRAGFTH